MTVSSASLRLAFAWAATFAWASCGVARALPDPLGIPFASDAPVVIDSDDGMEWLKKEQTYFARGAVMLRQGASRLEAESLRIRFGGKAPALEDEAASSDLGLTLTHMEAWGGIVVTTPSGVARARRGAFDARSDVLRLEGDVIRLRDAQGHLTLVAHESFTYRQKEGVAVARGDARMRRDNGTLRGDVLRIHLDDAGDGGVRRIASIEAVGHVEAFNDTHHARSERGVYDAAADRAILIGHVEISSHGRTASAPFGVFDFANGLSRLLSSAPTESGEGQVRVVIPFDPPPGVEEFP